MLRVRSVTALEMESVDIVLHELLEAYVICGDSPYTIHRQGPREEDSLKYEIVNADIRPGAYE
jgi:hypothetical protein